MHYRFEIQLILSEVVASILVENESSFVRQVVLQHVMVVAHRLPDPVAAVGGDAGSEIVRFPVDQVPAVVVGEDQVDETPGYEVVPR